MEDGTERQLAMWKLLGDTQAVVDATGQKLVRPGKVGELSGKAPARVFTQTKDRSATATVPYAQAGAGANGKHKLTIRQARYGNRAVISRRD